MFCGKVSGWLGQHPHVGWVHSSHPTHSPGQASGPEVNKAAFSTWLHQHSWAPLGSLHVQSALQGARRRAGPGPCQTISASEAARFQRPAAQTICCFVCPGEVGPPLGVPFCPQTELSLGLAAQAWCPRMVQGSQSRKLPEPGATAVPVAAPGSGLVLEPR